RGRPAPVHHPRPPHPPQRRRLAESTDVLRGRRRTSTRIPASQTGQAQTELASAEPIRTPPPLSWPRVQNPLFCGTFAIMQDNGWSDHKADPTRVLPTTIDDAASLGRCL